MNRESLLRFFLRCVGSVSLLALFAVTMPYAWMDATHQWLGLGHLPGQPIVGYLARSVSASYALLGGLLWVVSFDLSRHRAVLCYFGIAMMVFGVILVFVDRAEGLPFVWWVFEGPCAAAIGVVIFFLNRRIAPPGTRPAP